MINDPLHVQKRCELHVHLYGCLWADDLLALGADHYREIDWSLFVETYEAAYGRQPDPGALFEAALSGDRQAFIDQYVFSAADGGDFNRFQAKFNFLSAFYRHWWQVLQQEEVLVRQIGERHHREGVSYVEYRLLHGGLPEAPTAFSRFYRRHAEAVHALNRLAGFSARFLPGIPRQEPLMGYRLVRQMLAEQPHLYQVIVGLDFCAFEEGFPPKLTKAFFQQLAQDNGQRPEQALGLVYHVGESFFDKSLESAIRWCHEAAELGAQRLGHAIALGLEPAVAIGRRPAAHEQEMVSERLDQLAYDLCWRAELAEYGIEIDVAAVEAEGERLAGRGATELVERPYTPHRLHQIRRRQDFVLDRLTELGTVIESCPTSNLRIGGVPSPAEHPLHRFLASEVNLVIGADDPGLFHVTLADEIAWLVRHTAYSPAELAHRLGDPYHFRLRRSADSGDAGGSPAP